MAHRADFRVDFLGRAAGLEGITAAAVNSDLMVFWMYVFFHKLKLPCPKRLILNNTVQLFKTNFYKFFVFLATNPFDPLECVN